MATSRKSEHRVRRGLVQGIVLVTFPAANTVFTNRREYDLFIGKLLEAVTRPLSAADEWPPGSSSWMGSGVSMGTYRSATPEEHLQALAAGQAAILEGLARMQLGTLERCKLEEDTYLLVRLAALIATGAGPAAYRAHLGGAGDRAIPTAKVLATVVAVAPLVGSARVLSAASGLSRAGLLMARPEPSPAVPE